MKIKTISLLLGAAGLVAAMAVAPLDASPLRAKSNRMVSSEQNTANITRLMTEIPWYTSLDYVKEKAFKEDKPIFWVHMKGQMNGTT